MNDKILKEAKSFIKGQKKKPTAADLISHLEKKFPSAKKKTIENICSSHIPIPDPPPSVISVKPTSTSTNWYSYKSKNHHNYRVSSKLLKLPNKAKNNISASSFDLMNLLSNPSSSPFKPVSGLVIGNVQSGKTANFTALIARAADSEYNLIVVLSGGNFNDLRAQTQKRIFKDLVDPINATTEAIKWHKGTNLDVIKDGSGDVGGDNWNETWGFASENCIIITKKNVSTLVKLGEWLSNDILPKAMAKGVAINLLLIDDEADHASLNLALSKNKVDKEASRINEEVRKILHCVPNNTYIGFTASPFANMFVPPSKDTLKDNLGKPIPTLYPRDFIYLLPEPDGYFGLKKMCPGDVPKFGNFLNKVNEKEAIFYRENTEKKRLNVGIKDGMKASIFDFFIAIGVQFIREGHDYNFHQSMLIHTKETVRTMHGILETVTPFIKRMKHTILSKGTVNKIQKDLFDEFALRYANNKPSISKPPNFDQLIESLKLFFNDQRCSNLPHVLEISSDPKKGNNLRYPENQPYAVIAIGAARLSRGFTLENLYTTYFVREPKTVKSDTLLQQGRWFGFRGANEDLVNIHLTTNLRDHFWNLKLVEEDLHDTIRHFQISGLDPSYYAIPVMKAAGQIPTEIGKIPKMRKDVYGMLSGDYLPKRGSGFPINIGAKKAAHEQKNLDNLEAFGKLFDKMVTIRGKIPSRTPQGNYTFDSIPLNDVVDFFNDSLDNFIDDPYNKSHLLEYLKVRKSNGTECSSWTVVVVGNKADPKKDQLIRFNASSSNQIDLHLVSRTRIGKGVDDFRAFTQTNDFCINSKVTSGTTIKQHCGNREPENPILLVYMVNKDSKPTVTGRADLDTSEHIFTMAIGFPISNLTPDEKKKYNSEKWWNEHLNLE